MRRAPQPPSEPSTLLSEHESPHRACLHLGVIVFLLVQTAAVSLAQEKRFVERSQELGFDFVHNNFGTGERYMVETFGSGLVIFDANGDGRLDIYCMQGAPQDPGEEALPNQLFIQQEDGRFRDQTAEAGVGDTGYGMGATYGDIDRDGDLDLYVGNFGRNTLYRNRGDGTFEDITEEAGVGCDVWTTSPGFFDADNDGDLDLYVVNYVDFSYQNHKWCGDSAKQIRAYCHPDVYNGLNDVLYLNDGTGKFTEAGPESGVPQSTDGKGLGLSFGDLNTDGHFDIYVANDSTMNYVLLGEGNGRFTEMGLLSGAGFNAAGVTEASMGVAIGDLDGDGFEEVFVTHLDFETNTLYRNSEMGMFTDFTDAAGLAAAGLRWVGFGTLFIDHDHDTDLDIFVTNGHIIDNIDKINPETTYRQPTQLFDNRGDGHFVEISDTLDLPKELVGRGAAAGDLDRDGDLDIVFVQNNGPAKMLFNVMENKGNSLAVLLQGTKSNPQGFGARLELTVAGKRQIRDMRSASSYQSQSALEIFFGLGSAEEAEELIVKWPSGQVDRHAPLKAGFYYTLTEGVPEPVAVPFQ
jgi:hypothetical protein